MPAKAALIARLNDTSADVKIAAAEALSYLNAEEKALAELMLQLTHPSAMVRIHAANVIDAIGRKAKPVAKELQIMVNSMQQLKKEGKLPDENYLLTALSHTVSKL
jgi:HEAT repeat protein